MGNVYEDRGGTSNFRRLIAGSVDGNSPPRGNARTRDGTFTAPKAVEVENTALRPLEQAVVANQRTANALNQAVREVSFENQAASGAWAPDVEAAAKATPKLSELFGSRSHSKCAQPDTRPGSSNVQRLLG
jgi:hypothetical protein